jgi:anti-anti-sigma regulatory factor
MTFVKGETKGKGTLVWEGALTVSRVAELRDELLMTLKKVEKVALDLRAVTEIDLSALQLFCSAHRTAVKTQKCFELIDSSMDVARNTAGLNGFLRQQGCSMDQNKTCLWMVKRTA